jgi:hypothetical protein
MTHPPSSSISRHALAPLAFGIIGSAAVAAVSTYGVAGMAGWTTGAKAIQATAMGAGSCLAAAMIALAILALARTSDAARGMLILAASVARLLMSLLFALALFLLFNPEGKTFWVAFLLAGLLAIAVEAAWGVRELSKNHQPSVATKPASGSIGVS